MSQATKSFLNSLFQHFNQRLSRIPVPSATDQRELIRLESMKVNNPLDTSYLAEERKPDICGARPENIVVEVRQSGQNLALTYWYYWPWDLRPGDHDDWEPVTLVYANSSLAIVYGRAHNGLVSYVPYPDLPKQVVYFSPVGHLPVVRVRDSGPDVTLFPKGDNRDGARQTWLNATYSLANQNGWRIITQPPLNASGGPVLDRSNWSAWGKHAVYFRI